MHLIDSLEKNTDWGRIFGAIESLYNDPGFTSAGDNFARATAVEWAIENFSELERVDQTGYDFLFGESKVELKMGKNLFYKRKDIHATKKFKVKSFLSEKKTVEDFRKDKTFDYMMVIDLTARRVVIVEDEKARSLYQEGADGAMIELKLGDYYECDLGNYEIILPPAVLSELFNESIKKFLKY